LNRRTKIYFVTKNRKVESEKICFFVKRPIFTGENKVLPNEIKLGLIFKNEVIYLFIERQKGVDLLIFTHVKTCWNSDW